MRRKRDEIGYNIAAISIHKHKHHIVSEKIKKYIDLENCCCVPEQFETKKKEVIFSAFKQKKNFIHEMLIS